MDTTVLSKFTSLIEGTSPSTPAVRVNYRSLIPPRHIRTDPSRRSTHIRTPQELLSEFMKNTHHPLDQVTGFGKDSTPSSTESLSNQIAESLLNVKHFKHTFSTTHLDTRDHAMIDAFSRHPVYYSFRDYMADDTYLPTQKELDYPHIKEFSIASIIEAYKALHTVNNKTKSFVEDLSTHPDYWKSEEKLVQLHDQYLTLLYNIQKCKATLTDLIFPYILNSIEDNRLLVDTLYPYNASLPEFRLACATATAETANGFRNIKKISSAIARLHGSTLPRLLPSEVLDLEDIPTMAEYYSAMSTNPSSSVAIAQPPRSTSATTGQDVSPQEIYVSLKPSTNAPKPSTDSGPARIVTRHPSRRSHSPQPHERSRRTPSRSPERKQVRLSEDQPSVTCLFCRAHHYTSGCTITSLSERATRAVSEGKCLRCLHVHAPGYCRSNKKCRVCNANDHHTALCPYSYHVVRDIGPSSKAFFDKMYAQYESHYSRHTKH